jgi:hypothetical protein
MKLIITEEQKKKLFIPRKIDEREKEYQEIINKRLDDIKQSPIGNISKDAIFEWLHENNIDQQLKLAYKGPSLGEVYGSSYNKSTGNVILFVDDQTDKNIAISFDIKNIQIGTFDIPDDGDTIFYPIK